ncbi:MAG TPA: GNVR domain-containing protein [Patescibacteria group bacterium]|nr:GNVR domain-containing protein [Patescibacteria group bacterium]
MKEFVTVLFRRRRHVAAFFLFMAGVPVLLSYVLPPRYEATASLLLTSGREKKPFVPTEKDSHTPFLQVSMEDVGSEVEILLSRPVLAAVVDAQHLDQGCHPDPSETARYLACAAGRAFKALLTGTGLKARVPPREDAIDRLHRKVEVEFVKRTNVIEVSWRGDSPKQAKDVVNALVDAYLEHHIKVHGSAYAIDAVERQVTDSGTQLSQAEERLRGYQADHSISNLDKQHSELLEKLSEADTKVHILEGLGTTQVPTADIGNLAGDPTFLDLSRRLTDAELRRIDLSFKFNADSWQVTAVNKEIDQLRALVKERLAASLAKWKSLSETYRRELAALDQGKVALDRLQRDVDALSEQDRQSRDNLHEVQMSKGLDQANVASVKIVEYADEQTSPAFPKRLLVLIVSLFLAVVGAPVWAIVVDRMSGTVVSVDDLETTVDLPVLASIPELPGGDMNPEALQRRVALELAGVQKALGLDRPGGRGVHLVTSPTAGAGTSLVAAALAQAASSGQPGTTLLISFRKEALNGHASAAAATAPAGAAPVELTVRGSEDGVPFERAVVRLGDRALAAGDGAETLVENARSRYEHVVLDVPGTRGDGFHLRLLPRVDSVLLVAAYDRTGKHPLARMAEVIQRQGGRIAGCVLNRRREPIPEFIYRRLFW